MSGLKGTADGISAGGPAGGDLAGELIIAYLHRGGQMSELSSQVVCTHTWLAFSKDSSEETVRAAFRARYGREPETVGISLGNVLAGPVPTQARR